MRCIGLGKVGVVQCRWCERDEMHVSSGRDRISTFVVGVSGLDWFMSDLSEVEG